MLLLYVMLFKEFVQWVSSLCHRQYLENMSLHRLKAVVKLTLNVAITKWGWNCHLTWLTYPQRGFLPLKKCEAATFLAPPPQAMDGSIQTTRTILTAAETVTNLIGSLPVFPCRYPEREEEAFLPRPCIFRGFKTTWRTQGRIKVASKRNRSSRNHNGLVFHPCEQHLHGSSVSWQA